MDDIDKLEDSINTFKDNVRSSFNREIEELYKCVEDINEFYRNMENDINYLRDNIYKGIFSCISRKRHSIEDICTIRENNIYEYNESNVLEFWEFIENYEKIKTSIYENCLIEGKRSKLQYVTNVVEENGNLLKLLDTVENKETIVRTATKVPREFRPDILPTTEKYKLRYFIHDSTSDYIKIELFYPSSGKSEIMRGKSEEFIIYKNFEENEVRDITILSSHMDVIYGLVSDLRDLMEEASQSFNEITNEIEEIFVQELVSDKI
jgi:archaellum component FlaC